MLKNYETVFILNPVLSDDQTKEAVGKFVAHLKSDGAKIVAEESWGLKKASLSNPEKEKRILFFIRI